MLSLNPPRSVALPLPFSVGPCAQHSHCLWQRRGSVYLPTHTRITQPFPVLIDTRQRWGVVSLLKEDVCGSGARPCAAKRQKELCTISTWWRDSQGDEVMREESAADLVSKETVFALSPISPATERDQWVFVDCFSPRVIVWGTAHIKLPASTWVKGCRPFYSRSTCHIFCTLFIP